ncbi:MAG: hypothetical protein ACYDAN_13285 [Candidatus Limnocylindrales bacterium]
MLHNYALRHEKVSQQFVIVVGGLLAVIGQFAIALMGQVTEPEAIGLAVGGSCLGALLVVTYLALIDELNKLERGVPAAIELTSLLRAAVKE